MEIKLELKEFSKEKPQYFKDGEYLRTKPLVVYDKYGNMAIATHNHCDNDFDYWDIARTEGMDYELDINLDEIAYWVSYEELKNDKVR